MIDTFTLSPEKKRPKSGIGLEEKFLKEKLINSSRLYYLDWLRVLAFSVLILMHTGEVFTEKNFWIKNGATLKFFDYVLFFFKQWRMPLLFVISGAAVSIMFNRNTVTSFIKNRIAKVLLPLFGAMLLIIPPQIYFIEKAKGKHQNFIDFYLRLIEFSWFPKGNLHWLHLWYLAFVFIFTISVIPVMIFVRSDHGKKIMKSLSEKIAKPFLLFIYALAASIPYYLLCYVREGNVAELLYYFPYFLFGVLFLTNPVVAETLKENALKILGFACITGVLIYLSDWLRTSENFFYLTIAPGEIKVLSALLKTANQWLWLQAILGLSMRYLSSSGRQLKYLNQLVFPIYILHQTVIIIVGYYVIQVPGSITFKFSAILLGSLLIMLGLYEAVLKRAAITRLLFGIK